MTSGVTFIDLGSTDSRSVPHAFAANPFYVPRQGMSTRVARVGWINRQCYQRADPLETAIAECGKLNGSRNAPACSAVPERPACGAASKGSGLGTGRCNPRLLADPPLPAISIQPLHGWFTSMPNDQDLFAEEQSMVTMSFGEHIEELRVRLILALIGLFVGVIVVFIPPLDIGWRVMKKMEEPAKEALDVFYSEEYDKKARAGGTREGRNHRSFRPSSTPGRLSPSSRRIAPKLDLPEGETLQGQKLNLPVQFFAAGMIDVVRRSTVQIDQSLVSLAPLETLTIFFMVCLVSGLVLASPWVFYQIWAFVAAGLYRHERRYVKKYLPFSLGLFLAGVFLCFFFVLPITLTFLLQFNVWLGVAPTLRLSDGWASPRSCR